MHCIPQVSLFTLDGTFTGSSDYPTMKLVSSIQFERPYALVNVFFNSQIYIGAGAPVVPGAWCLVLGNGVERVSIGNTLRSIVSHVGQIPLAGSKGQNQEDWCDLGQYGIPIASGQKLSLYASGTNVAVMYAIANLQLIPTE